MATITGPLLSIGARGSIAKTMVASSWKGRAYMRQHVKPANPNTTAQQEQRQLFRFLNNVYRTAPAIATAPWDSYASGQVMTGRNGFLKINATALYGQSDLDLLTFSPGSKGGLPTGGSSATPGDDLITCAATAPALPAGWTIAAMQCAAIEAGDPQSSVFYTVSAAEDATPAYSVDITGLKSATTYQVAIWFKYNRPDGSFAYGPADLFQVLTT